MLYENDDYDVYRIAFYPCVKYKFPADPTLDGTDYFIDSESMHWKGMELLYESFNCSLSFTCENDQTAFYKLIKVCLQFRVREEPFCDFLKQCWFSLILSHPCHYK